MYVFKKSIAPKQNTLQSSKPNWTEIAFMWYIAREIRYIKDTYKSLGEKENTSVH